MMRGVWPLLLALLLIAPPAAASEPIKLRFSAQMSIAEPLTGVPITRFKEQVERETGNAIIIEIFDNSRLYTDDKVIDGVASGGVEMGLAPLYGISKFLPAAGFLEQPFLFNFDGLVQAATSPESDVRKLMDDAVLRTLGLRVLWWETIGSQSFFSKEGDARHPGSIEGKKMRAASATASSFATHCGGVPFIVSTAKIHQALGDGTLDMAMMAPAVVWTRDLWQVTTAITRTDHADGEFLVVINEKAWQSLSPDHQKIFVQVARRVEREVRERSVQLNEEAYAFARSKGMKIYELSSHDVAEWRACSSDVLVDFMDKGGELAQALMSAYGRLRTDPCCSAGPQGDKDEAKSLPMR